MAVTPHDGPTKTFVVFSGATYTVTNVTVNYSDVSGATDRIDVSHLGQTTGETMLTQARPLKGSATGETGEIGSDVPACIESKDLKLKGYGDKIFRIKNPDNFYFLIIYPNIKLCTKDVFNH